MYISTEKILISKVTLLVKIKSLLQNFCIISLKVQAFNAGASIYKSVLAAETLTVSVGNIRADTVIIKLFGQA